MKKAERFTKGATWRKLLKPPEDALKSTSRKESLLWWCAFVSLWSAVVSYLVSPPVWSYRLGQTADRAGSSVANGDAPLAYEHATAFAFRGHNIHSLYKWRSSVSDQSETKLTARTMALTWRYGRNGKIA
jgi:hypothetical protein